MSHTASISTLALNGGEKTRTAEWPTYDKGYVDLNQGDESAALRAIRSRRLFRYDNRPHGETEVGQFEQELADFFDAPHVLACSSGTTALALALISAACPAGRRRRLPGLHVRRDPQRDHARGGDARRRRGRRGSAHGPGGPAGEVDAGRQGSGRRTHAWFRVRRRTPGRHRRPARSAAVRGRRARSRGRAARTQAGHVRQGGRVQHAVRQEHQHR